MKVRDIDSALEFVGHVTQVTTGPVGPVYEVKYDETDEVEKHIAPDRLRKVKSARLQNENAVKNKELAVSRRW